MASVSAGLVALTVLAIYALAYIYYGRRILERQVVQASASRKTPAYTKFDGVDYVPANKYVLYGHHFASIAGAGPIVGPAIAMAYGWGLPLLWVIFGNVFIGAVHDYLSLMASVRHGGVSIMSVSENVMGRKAKYVFLLYVYFALILVLAAFFSVNALLFAKQPSAATKAMIYMPIAVLLGFLLYRTRMGPSASTAVAIALLLAGIAFAIKYPFLIPGDAYHTWLLLLAAYSFIASVLPVWYLLQPRDYLNAYVLWGFVALAILGSLGIAAQGLTGPVYTSFAPPIFGAGKHHVPTPFWPAIPLIIACGSLSGFHSIVASGTTSKQLASELDALLIGYGGMLTEGAVSSMAVIIPIAFAWSHPDFPRFLEYAAPGLLDAYKARGVLGFNAVQRFTTGYGFMLGEAMGGNMAAGKVMMQFAGIALATFVLTTLDTATRLARFAWQEMFDWLADRSPAGYKIVANKYVASAIAVLAGLALAYPNVTIVLPDGKTQVVPAFKIVWPAFSGVNQLLAALALLTSALWVYAVLRKRDMRTNALIQAPAWFLWITVTLALIWWMVRVMPTYPPIQMVGTGVIVAISLAVDFLLIYLYVTGLRRAKLQAAREAEARRP